MADDQRVTNDIINTINVVHKEKGLTQVISETNWDASVKACHSDMIKEVAERICKEYDIEAPADAEALAKEGIAATTKYVVDRAFMPPVGL